MLRQPVPPVSDEQLIHDARQGDRQAFDELVRRFRSAMIVIAHQATGSPELAEDVVQDAFLQAFHALPQLRDPGKFVGWLGVITRTRARRVGARDHRYEPTDSESLDRLLHAARGEAASEPGEEVVRASEQAEVRAAIAQLQPEHQAVLWLYYFEQQSVRQIAAQLAIPVATVKWRLHRSRHLLRQRLAAPLAFASGASEIAGEWPGRPSAETGPRIRGHHPRVRRSGLSPGRGAPTRRRVPARGRSAPRLAALHYRARRLFSPSMIRETLPSLPRMALLQSLARLRV